MLIGESRGGKENNMKRVVASVDLETLCKMSSDEKLVALSKKTINC